MEKRGKTRKDPDERQKDMDMYLLSFPNFTLYLIIKFLFVYQLK